ncbi:MAG: hypothetical protein DMG49_25175 [Acidobacteria bacterium]|nr:MAG: hypothetical protein DMG49_25175 [Acidobacteriota bacterium]
MTNAHRDSQIPHQMFGTSRGHDLQNLRRVIAAGTLRKFVIISAARIALGASPQPEAPLRRQNLSKVHGQPILRAPDLRQQVSVGPIPVAGDDEVSA